MRFILRGRRSGERGASLIELLGAIVIIGLGVTLFLKTQKMSRYYTSGNTKLLKAGALIEKQLEDMRINIAQNPAANFPANAANVTVVSPAPPDSIKLALTVMDALSPRDGKVVANAKRVDLVASWGKGPLDSVKVTTYVSKSF